MEIGKYLIPPQLLKGPEGRFVASSETERWMRATFIDDGAPLNNPEHAHLQDALIGVLWTNVCNVKQGNRIAGTAEVGKAMGIGGKWQKARQAMQILDWFGDEPDFIITLDAIFLSEVNNATFCAVVEHELYHCGQAKDEFGQPKYTRDGAPVYGMRGHDIEEFIGVMRRYGAGASIQQAREFSEAALAKPMFDGEAVDFVCGNCVKA